LEEKCSDCQLTQEKSKIRKKSTRISGLANFKIISRKPLIKMPRKKLSCSKKQDGKVSEKKMKLTQEGSKKKLLENNAD